MSTDDRPDGQPPFAWTDRDRALLQPGCTVVVYRRQRHPHMIKVVKVHRDHVFHELVEGGYSFMSAPIRSFVTEEIANCDPTSLVGYVAETLDEPEPPVSADE